MKRVLNIYAVFLLLLLIIGCSVKKDAFLNRSFHSVNTKYNILYNGESAYDRGLQTLYDDYKDNYRERLPIERLEVVEIAIPGIKQSGGDSNPLFEKSEEKAVKAIQKHSMNIHGKEQNQQIDEAYLLLGKTRYYSQRFVPALDAFNYIILNNPKADLLGEAKVWQAKAFLRLQNEEQALDNLQKTLNRPEFLKGYVVESAHTAIAMVFTEMDSTQKVLHHLKQAVLTNFDKEQTARNTYIIGQIYRELNYLDSSNVAFQKVIDMKKAPYRYRIHSEIEIAKNLSGNADTQFLIETLSDLTRDRENRPYLNELHYHIGLLYKKSGQIDMAIEHLKTSAHAKKANRFQINLALEELGNIQFDKANYVDAGAYYDTVLGTSSNKKTKRLRRLERKRVNLEHVIYFESIAQFNDSILDLTKMSLDEQVAYFQSYVDDLIAQEKKEKEQYLTSGFGVVNTGGNNQFSGDGKWYFYNTQVVGFGAQEFNQIWGNRLLEDNWRRSDKRAINSNDDLNKELVNVEIDDERKYDVKAYIEQIPTSQKSIDSISTIRNDAYYQLGLVYKEQFRQNTIAADKFEDLLSFSPEEKFILPSKYHLYKIYTEINPEKAAMYKEQIVTAYPDSKYTKLVLNPHEVLTEEGSDENSSEKKYEDFYCAYQYEKYEEVIEECDLAISTYAESFILPKFELLRAYAIGKRDGTEAFQKALEFVSLNYSNSEEGKKAAEVLETINKL
ncbi:MAG: hypothetical protein KAH07_02810 [Flavobacteriaceae bacterium]|nr:hypothetical protein [Flavobacteriaceae bacterium]